MAHFYARMQGNRKLRTCCGTKHSGITAHIRGWNVGVQVELRHNEETGKDEVVVLRTAGSNGRDSNQFIAKFEEYIPMGEKQS